MQIKSPKDFWAGLMFMGIGGFFAIWAYTHYQMGTAVRMGPAYFPTVLGGLLLVLGLAVFLESFVLKAEGKGARVDVPFNIIDFVIAIAILVASVWILRKLGVSSDWGLIIGTAIVTALTIWKRPGAKPLVLISAACVVYGYVMKPFGLVLATLLLVVISAFGGHEFKWREVAILYVLLIIFSVLVFVKGLTLPFPLWPAAWS
ncbi:MAG TPA: tripartite tricarboxylate transporter TctB family protein [Burkholderiales bacterium]|nr:tripartite tricarboxylate transporter TctB family protein [Burkholderiales bacterium]